MRQLIATMTTCMMAISAAEAVAQDESQNRVAAKTDWSVFVEDEPTKSCWTVSAPKESVNTRDGRVVAVRRDSILLFVAHRPGDSVFGEVSFTGGYPFADGSTVSLQIGDATYQLFTEGEWAWSPTPADDTKIITSMKRGTDAVLTALSSRGTTTKDTFSLLGFTAAVEEAESRCPASN